MITINVTVDGCGAQTIVIGRRATYETLQVVFNISYLIETYGNGAAVLVAKRSQDETAYPATVTQDGNTLTWIVSETDTYYVGAGECELMWYVNGGLAKTIIYPVVVLRDMLQTTEEPPDAYENWIEHLTALGAETQQNALDAAQSATDAENAATRAEDALEEFTTPTASATSLAPDQQATAAYSDGHFSFGIPRGTPGTTGETPDFSIGTIETLEPDQPATATITGTPENPVLNLGIPKGEKGKDGGGAVESVNGKTGVVVLEASDVGAKPASYEAPVSSVAGKTGAVTLNANDVAFSDSGSYDEGTIGAELSKQKNAIDQKQDAPCSAGTAGQVLGLDSNLDPVWVNQSGGGDVSNCAPVIINTSSGATATFSDGAGGRVIESVSGTIVPLRNGSGTPSSENIIPILGFNNIELIDTTRNIIAGTPIKTIESANISSNKISSNNYMRVYVFRVPKTALIMYKVAASTSIGYAFGNDPDISFNSPVYDVGINNTTYNNTSYNYLYVTGARADNYPHYVVSIGARYTTFAYGDLSNCNIAIPSEIGTVFGGSFTYNKDGSVSLISTMAEIASYNGETLPGAWLSDRDVYAAGTTPTIGAQVVYELATPLTYTFTTANQLELFKGYNNIWVNSGEITNLNYPADTKLYVDGLTAPDEDMIADANIASGKYFVVNNQLYLSTAAIAAGASIIPGTNCTATNIAAALNAINT